jgi:hypothetical protein
MLWGYFFPRIHLFIDFEKVLGYTLGIFLSKSSGHPEVESARTVLPSETGCLASALWQKRGTLRLFESLSKSLFESLFESRLI